MVTYSLEKDVPTEDVAVESEEYCFDFGTHTRATAKDTGPLFPPVLYREQGHYEPVLGRSQVLWCRDKGVRIPALLVLEGPSPGLAAVRFSVLLKQALGGFSVVEKSIALRRLKVLSPRIEDEILDMLGVPRNESMVQNMITLADAPIAIKQLVHEGVMHENTAFEIFKMARELWQPVARFICTVPLGTKKRNEVVSMLRDIARRDGREISDLLENSQIRDILRARDIDPPQRGERLYNYVRALRYPSVHEFRQRFDTKLREVHLDRQFHLILPENFERWEFKLVVPFSSAEEFQKHVEELRKTAEGGPFKDLMDMRY